MVDKLSVIIKYFSDFLYLFFPSVCEACGQSLRQNEGVVCIKCLFDLPRTDYFNNPDNPVINLFAGRLKLEKATALFSFQKGSRFRKLLHNLKYKNKPEIGILLGRELGAEMKKSGNFSDIDVIIPVPLHTKRLKERGYNQSEMIGRGISEVTSIPQYTNVFFRNEYTKTQTKMTREERWKNVSGKFVVENAEFIENKHVMLVDDVITTGSTLEACGEILLNTKGLKLSIAILAKA